MKSKSVKRLSGDIMLRLFDLERGQGFGQISNAGLAFAGSIAMLRSQIAENGPEMPPDIPTSKLKK